MIGQSHLWIGKPDEAIQHFNLYLRQYPDGDRVNEAEKAIQMARELGKQKTGLEAQKAFVKEFQFFLILISFMSILTSPTQGSTM